MTDAKESIRQLLLGVPQSPEALEPINRRKELPSVSLVWILSIILFTSIITASLGVPLVFAMNPPEQFIAPQNLLSETQEKSFSLPSRIIIPKIYVDAPIEHLGFTQDGSMDNPVAAQSAGWFKEGPIPGEKGSAVITGHLNAEDGSPGIFEQLHLLKVRDEIVITSEDGTSQTFLVLESRMYGSDEDVPEIFYRSDSHYINLITCSGAWNSAQQKYEDRLVVFAVLKP